MANDVDAHLLVAQRYRLEMLLGRGGMGEVYRALDLETNERVAQACSLLRRTIGGAR